MSVKPQDAKGIFLAALDIPDAAERAAFVERSCGGDAALGKRVDDLLSAYGQPDGPLDKLAAAFASTEIAEPIREQVGATIGPYKLMEQMGEGGFGLVFVAEQQQPIRRKVALKIIKPGMDTRDVIARFEAERQALALMDHPNIARVLDAGTTESGRPYFVMELVRGIPITDYCDQGQLTPRERLELFVPVCNAIQHAHMKGIIHRDIKPSNVLVTLHDGKPVVKVIDFGVAKALHQSLTEKTVYTRFAQMIGTPLYMSPEQAEMSGLDIDTRTDVYSLGVLLYELLTGVTPFDKQRLAKAAYDELLKIIREEDPPKPSLRLSQSGDSLPSIAAQRRTEPARLSKMFHGDLDWITMKALEKDRGRRYETANAFAADVLRYLNDEPVEASPPSAAYRLRKLARKHRAALMIAGSFAALLVAGAVISGWMAFLAYRAEHAALIAEASEREQRRTAEAERARAVDAELRERQQRRTAEANADDARRSRYVSDMQLAEEKWEQGDPAACDGILHKYATLSGPNDVRGWEWYYQERLCHQELRTFRGHGVIVKGPAETRSGEITSTTDDEKDVNGIAFSPDGQRLATAGDDGTVRIWDVATAAMLMTLKGHTRRATGVVFSPDGSRLASAATDHTIRIWSARTGDTLSELHIRGIGVHALAFSSDGSRLASLDWKGEVCIWDPVHGRSIRWLYPFGERTMTAVDGRFSSISAAFSADLNRVARFEVTEMSGGLCDLNNGQRTQIANRSQSVLTCLRFSPDGRQVAACWEGAPISLQNVAGAKGAERQFDRSIEHGLSLAFTFDGAILACGEATGSISLWRVGDGKLLRRFAGHDGPVKCLAFNSDGGRLASGSSDGTARLWDILGTRLRSVSQVDVRSQQFVYQADFGNGSITTSRTQVRTMSPAVLAAQSVKLLRTGSRVGDFAVSPSGDAVAIAAHKGRDFAVPDQVFAPRKGTIWDTRVGVPIADPLPSSPDEVCRALFFHPDGTCVAALLATTPTSLSIAHVPNRGRPRVKLDLPLLNGQPVEDVIDVAFSCDGTCVAAALAGDGNAQSVEIWELRTGKAVRALNGFPTQIKALRFTRNGRLVICCGRQAILCGLSEHDKPEPLQGMLRSDVWPKSMATSPENRSFAVADGNEIVVWNLDSRKLVRRIAVGSEINCLAFNANGSRLVAGIGRVLKIWDMPTGQELRSFSGHTGTINAVAFTSDGFRLISGGDDHTVRIYDARPMNAELQVENEALTLCEALGRSATSDSDLVERISNYPGVGDPARQCAKEMVPQFWDAEVNDRAKTIVINVWAKNMAKEYILEQLRNDPSLGREVRAAALVFASRITDSPDRLKSGSWKFAARADASTSEYEHALRAAETAGRLAPRDLEIPTILGALQYRLKRYVDAVDTLSQSNQDRSTTSGDAGAEPSAVAFLAMAHHALGHEDLAQRFFRQLIELLNQDKWKTDPKANALLNEARQQLARQSTPSNLTAPAKRSPAKAE